MFKNKKSEINERFIEEELYAQVANEIKNGIKKEGLWIKALVDSNNNEEEAKVLYLKHRVQSIKDENEVLAEKKSVELKEEYRKRFFGEIIKPIIIFLLVTPVLIALAVGFLEMWLYFN